MCVVEISALRERFAEGNLRTANSDFCVELTADTLDVNLEVKLTHALDDGFARLFVAHNAERWVFLRKAVERLREVHLSCLVLWRNSKLDNRLRDEHRRHGVAHRAVRKRITRRTVHTEHRHDIARNRLVDIVHFVRVHTDETWNLHLLAVGNVDDGVALLDGSLVDTHVCELTIASVLKLERKHDEVLRWIALKRDLLLVVVLVKCFVLDVEWRWKQRSDSVKKRLNTLVLVGRAAEYWRHLERQCTLANSCCELFCADWLVHQELLHQRVVEVSCDFHELMTKLLRLCFECCWDWLATYVNTTLAVEVQRLHVDHVDYTLELVFQADCVRDKRWVVRELLTKLLSNTVRICTLAVALVDEGNAWHAVAAHLAVHCDGLRLHTSNRAENKHGAVKHAKRTLNFHRKVHVTRSINQVDVEIAPRAVRGS